MNVRNHMRLLGRRVEDRVTGMRGIVASVSFDLYGCIQAIVNPGLGADGKPLDQHWFDVNRLKVIDDTPVMAPPDFDFGPVAEGRRGAAEKPASTKV